MGVAKKNVKATKKFEKNHLKGVLEKRKAGAKIKQRQQIQAKKQAKRSQDADFFKKTGEVAEQAASRKKRPDANVSSMSVDDFFQGGFQIIDGQDGEPKPTTAASPAHLGKRKRTGAAAEEETTGTGATGSSDDDDNDDDSQEGDAGMSKAAMEALAEKDPEFYQFLKENDPEALDFDEDADLAEIDELSPGEEEDEDDSDEDASDEEGEAVKRPRKKQKKAKAAAAAAPVDNELTRAMVSKWRASMAETYSLRAARQVVLAFRSAAHLNEKDADDDGSAQRYSIKSPAVFHEILMAALEQVPLVLQHHVPVKESAAHRVYVPTETKKFKTLSLLVRSFAASVLHLLGTLSDDGTLKLTLSALTPLLPYLLSFRKLLKHVIKTVVAFWAQPASSETTRITAFLVLRRLVVIGDKGVREAVLKATYLGLVQGCRTTNANTLAGIHLMKNSAAELWGIDPAIGYTTAFAAIRQLAIHLRNSIVHNQNNAFRVVYNWQYVHSLDFWSVVLAEHCSPLREAEGHSGGSGSQLKLLVYPLVQVTLGAMRLIPTAMYFPLRFQLFRSLLRVSRATGTYIPLAPLLLEVLSSAEMKKGGRSAGADVKELDFAVAYKAPKSYLRTTVYQTAVGEQVVELLSEYFALWATSIAFPELALPVVIMLKRWLKEARKRGGSSSSSHGRGGKGSGYRPNSKVIAGLVLLVQKLEANAKFIEDRRARVDFAPRDRTQVDAFLKDFDWQKTPVGAFVMTQRQLNADKQRGLAEARKEDAQKRLEEKKQVREEMVVDEEEEEDEEDEEGEEDEEDGDDDDDEDEEEEDEDDDLE
ncbi:ribosome assembly protein [Grosmannia clavigera kw1407]|uniref:Ribosome assembly protein n=1 Tax=Grosmannia clavigera (strain kw1407 / UAMH 11150) TaxID=655863 RepID=F0XSA4_GROCL|nr:ribosome assembly protein [Grosmannia clavigera kw1407]EFW99414.1 ribosome assembly protein [Grosmannia clavigera kw1407]